MSRFQPGVSGNPRGRPTYESTKTEVTRLAREKSPDAIRTLARICDNEEAPPAARVAAATALLDRGWGKPTQPIDANINFLDRLSEHEQAGLLAALDALAGEPAGAQEGVGLPN